MAARGGARLQLQLQSNLNWGGKFQMNFKSCVVKLGCRLDGRVRWRKVTVTVTMKWSWGVVFKTS